MLRVKNIVTLARPCVYVVPCANLLFVEEHFLLVPLLVSFGKFLEVTVEILLMEDQLRGRFPNFPVGLESLLTQQQTTFATLAKTETQ